MAGDEHNDAANAHGGGRFATTQWSLVLSAADRASPGFQQALAELCGTYWYPLYAFVRRQGASAVEAEDLTQEFFLALVDKEFLAATGPEKGRFRTFLLLCLKRFLANQRDRQHAQKRGGGRTLVSINRDEAESRYQAEPADAATPERIYERRWALALLDQVLARLEDEYRQARKSALFARLKIYLVADAAAESHAAVAADLGLSTGAVKVAVHRLRRRYGELLRAEVARTLEQPRDVKEEIQSLFAALRR
ncbi:MAG: sigma-70 family RNA polymerase sigma factor [Pirellulales bacterium]